MDVTQILHMPVQTEKANRASTEGQHTFYVPSGVSKIEIMQAVRAIYGVKPKAVHIVRLPKKFSGRGRMKRRVTTKAVVILQKGAKLDPLKTKS